MVRLADYVTPPEAAEIIGCTKGRVYQMLRGGEFNDLLKFGKRNFLISKKEAQKVASSPSSIGRPRKKMAS